MRKIRHPLKYAVVALLITSTVLAAALAILSTSEWLTQLQLNQFGLPGDVAIFSFGFNAVIFVICFYLLFGCGLGWVWMAVFDAALSVMAQTRQSTFNLYSELSRLVIEVIQYVGFDFDLRSTPGKQHCDYPLAKNTSLSPLPYLLFPVSCILRN